MDDACLSWHANENSLSSEDSYEPCSVYLRGVLSNGLDAAIREFVSTIRALMDRRHDRRGPQGSHDSKVL